VLGGTLGGWIGMQYGWRSVFSVFGVIGAGYAVLLLFLLRNPDRPTAEDVPGKEKLRDAAGEILRTPGFWPLLTVFVIASICDWAIYTWMPLYLYETFHFSLVKAGFTATFYIKAGGFASPDRRLPGRYVGGTIVAGPRVHAVRRAAPRRALLNV